MARPFTYKIFYASRDASGRMWCGDCRVVESLLSQTFSPASGLKSEIIYVGDRPTWKDPKSSFRQAPLRLTGVPTILKVNAEGGEVARIVEGDILEDDRLKAFLKSGE